MSYRYWIAPDNTLPLLFAERVAHHGLLTVPLLAGWHTSDRPPLQTGFTLMLYPLFGRESFGYELLGAVLQALWISALWILRARAGWRGQSARRRAGHRRHREPSSSTRSTSRKDARRRFALAALAVVLEEDSLILVAVLAALALLLHGGIAFSLLALLPLVSRLRPSASKLGLALLAGVALYLPWMSYQRFIDPPRNRLLKWQIAPVVPPRSKFISAMASRRRPP